MSAPAWATPSAPPRPRATPGLVLVTLTVLAGLAWLDARAGGTAPIALGVSLLAVYLGLCLTHLETAVILILAVAPFSVESRIPGTGSALQLPTEPMLFVALAAWLGRTLSRGLPRFRHPEFQGMLVLALVACVISMLRSTFPMVAAKAILTACWYAAFGLFLMHNLNTTARQKTLVAAWIIPGVLLSVNSIANVLSGRYDHTQGYWSAAPFFSEHGTWAAYMSFLFTLSLALTVEGRGTSRFGFGALALLFGAQVLLSFTRGAWIGVAVAAVPLAIYWRRRLLTPGGVGLGAAAVLLAIVLLLSGDVSVQLGKHTGTVTDPTYTSNLERLNRWYAGWKMFESSPVTGVGYGTYINHYLNNRRTLLATDQSTIWMGIHSEYLRVLAETGLIGFAASLLAGLVLAGIAARAIRRAVTPLRLGLAIGMSAGLITYLAHAVVNNFIQYDKAAVPVWTAIGVLGAIAATPPPSESS